MAKEKIRTPKGTLQYPSLEKPDVKYVKEGEYRTKLVIPAGTYADFQAQLDEKMEEARENGEKKAKGGDLEPYLPYEINDEGAMVINTKLKALVTPDGKEPFKQKPQIADAKGNIITKKINIGSGTQAKLMIEPVIYFTPGQPKKKLPASYGLTLRLRGVQILALKQWNGAMFGADEDGEYTYEEGDDDFDNEVDNDEGDATANEVENSDDF